MDIGQVYVTNPKKGEEYFNLKQHYLAFGDIS
jgi:hypothetical protein